MTRLQRKTLNLLELSANNYGHLLCDRCFRKTPMYLETPKGQKEGVDWDVINLRTLREL